MVCLRRLLELLLGGDVQGAIYSLLGKKTQSGVVNVIGKYGASLAVEAAARMLGIGVLFNDFPACVFVNLLGDIVE